MSEVIYNASQNIYNRIYLDQRTIVYLKNIKSSFQRFKFFLEICIFESVVSIYKHWTYINMAGNLKIYFVDDLIHFNTPKHIFFNILDKNINKIDTHPHNEEVFKLITSNHSGWTFPHWGFRHFLDKNCYLIITHNKLQYHNSIDFPGTSTFKNYSGILNVVLLNSGKKPSIILNTKHSFKINDYSGLSKIDNFLLNALYDLQLAALIHAMVPAGGAILFQQGPNKSEIFEYKESTSQLEFLIGMYSKNQIYADGSDNLSDLYKLVDVQQLVLENFGNLTPNEIFHIIRASNGKNSTLNIIIPHLKSKIGYNKNLFSFFENIQIRHTSLDSNTGSIL